MSISYTNFNDYKLSETIKSDDTNDEANRRREMRRKQQNAAIKIQNQSRISSKNLLDEVLGKEFFQSKTKSLANQSSIGRNQGLPIPAMSKYNETINNLDGQRKSTHVFSQTRVDDARDFFENRDLSKADHIDNFNKFDETLEVNEALEMGRHSSEHNGTNAEVERQSSLVSKKLPLLPLTMMTAQLEKLKMQILLIDKNHLHDEMNPQTINELAQQLASMTNSLDFLEGYADGVLKDEEGRKQFEQSCNDLREQLLQSVRNFGHAMASTEINQPKQLYMHSESQSQRVAEVNNKIINSTQQVLDDRARIMEDSAEIQQEQGKEKSFRLDDINSTQRVRAAKRDRANAESTLPLLVQRSV